MDYFDMEMLAVKNAKMFVDGYKAGLVKGTSYKGLCKVASELDVDLSKEFYFIGKMDEEYSVVCITDLDSAEG